MIKYFLVGEYHGTKESPEAFYEIIKKNKIKKIALEFDKAKQFEIDEFISGKKRIKELSIFENKLNHDGRASEAIKKLIVRLKKEKFQIFFVDDSSNIIKRDLRMAENLKEIKGKVAFLCGNVHASKIPVKFNIGLVLVNNLLNLLSFSKIPIFFRNKIITCGSLLPKKETISYNIIALNGGNYYNFNVKKLRKNKTIKIKSEMPTIIKSYQPDYDFFYIIDKFTASK